MGTLPLYYKFRGIETPNNRICTVSYTHLDVYKRQVVALCGALGLATTAVLVVNFTGSGLRQLGRNLDIIPKYPYVSTATLLP